MSATRHVRAISEGGRLVGIFAALPRPQSSASGAPIGQLRAGPGQEEHELEVEWPTERAAAAITEALHAQVKKALRLR
jgi:hypothetical protein